MKTLYVFDFSATPKKDWRPVCESTIAEDIRHALAQIYHLYPDHDVTRLTRGNKIVQSQRTTIEATIPRTPMIAGQ
ncbi:hypothetical protein UFOVP434_81 [uncultured Caudovirales phage]|uniref:Uncharacterized protein n=1 Tax=uncultured Caudovirales phage TaxID=2100421 RepID=A0A6J5MCV3_9CAUD|nr:hypothetical protein UFOVP434_81 [uncultured Caudovirales phage]